MKEFKSAVRSAEDLKEVSVKVDGRKIVFNKPKQAIFAEIALSTRQGATVGDKLEGVYSFFGGDMDEDGVRPGGSIAAEDWDFLYRKLRDSSDDFDLDLLMEIMEYVVEEFSANPTT